MTILIVDFNDCVVFHVVGDMTDILHIGGKFGAKSLIVG